MVHVNYDHELTNADYIFLSNITFYNYRMQVNDVNDLLWILRECMVNNMIPYEIKQYFHLIPKDFYTFLEIECNKLVFNTNSVIKKLNRLMKQRKNNIYSFSCISKPSSKFLHAFEIFFRLKFMNLYWVEKYNMLLKKKNVNEMKRFLLN